MNDVSNVVTAAPETATHQSERIEPVPFGDLYVSELNCRTVIDAAGIRSLADNIRDRGLIQNLAGLRDEKGKVGIVAGGRRLRALALLQDDERFQVVPVMIAPDVFVAKAWAASENYLRETPHPADEIREYARMEQDGIPVPSIALAFGVSERHVHRRLKLACLPKGVLAALKADEITLSIAACFTICEDEAHALMVLDRVRAAPMGEGALRRLLKPASVRNSDRRAIFVGQEAYVEAGGRMTRDLFAAEVLFDDPDILDEVFAAKLASAAEDLRDSEGWKWVATSQDNYIGWHQIEDMNAARIYPEAGELSGDQSARYDALAELAEIDNLDAEGEAELEALQSALDGTYSDVQKALSGALVHVDSCGQLGTYKGLVAKADKAGAVAAGILAPTHDPATEDAPKPAISAALRADLDRIACAARQNAALDHPDLLLDLLAFQLSGRMGYRDAFGLRSSDIANRPESEGGFEVDPRLSAPQACPKDPWGADLARGFRAFRRQGAKQVRKELIRQLARLLSVEDAKLGKLIDKEAGTSIRSVWTPTSASFFKRVTSSYLDDLHRDLLGLKPEHPSVTTFARLKKAEKAEKLESLFGDAGFRKAHGLSAEQMTRIDAWLPEDMG